MSIHDSKQIETVKVMLLKGDSGSTIVSIEKTGTSGLVDTYTITMSDGSKSTFTVSNGKEIVSVEKTGTSGLVDTYTMTFNDESTETFEVVNGNGIASIEKTGTQGAVDTYTITLDDGTTYTFTVTNATGTVDSDFSEISQNPVENRVITNKIKAMDDNIAGTEDGATSSQTYLAGEFILRNNQLYKVTTNIAIGDALTVGVNISADSVGEELSQINSNLSELTDMNTVVTTLANNDATYIGPYNVPCFLTIYGSKSSASSNASHCEHYTESGTYTDLVLQNPSETGVFNISFMLAKGDHVTLTIYNTDAKAIITKKVIII